MTKHGSPELDADAAKLKAMGGDPGMTLADLNAGTACTCVSCGDCGGGGTVWFDIRGKYLGDRRCDDCDTIEGCDTCRGTGIIEMCDRCQWAWQEEMDRE